MKLKKIVRLACVASSVLLLSACATTGSSDQNGAGSAGGKSNMQANGTETSGVSNGANLQGESQYYSLNAPAKQIYHFGFNMSNVESKYMDSIQAQAKYLIGHPNAKVMLAGNTDPIGTAEYNVALGWRRAQAVASVLMSYGVPKNQIEEMSYGEEKLVTHNPSDYWENRRTVLTYLSE